MWLALLRPFLPYIIGALLLAGVIFWWSRHWADYRHLQSENATLESSNQALQKFAAEQVRQRKIADEAVAYRDKLRRTDAKRIKTAQERLRDALDQPGASDWRVAPVPAGVAAGVCSLVDCARAGAAPADAAPESDGNGTGAGMHDADKPRPARLLDLFRRGAAGGER